MQQGELLTIYVMLAIASSLAGHDVLRVSNPDDPLRILVRNTRERLGGPVSSVYPGLDGGQKPDISN